MFGGNLNLPVDDSGLFVALTGFGHLVFVVRGSLLLFYEVLLLSLEFSGGSCCPSGLVACDWAWRLAGLGAAGA